MKEINLKLTLDEVNIVLKALGNMSFTQVKQLIGKVQTQAEQQLKEKSKEKK